MGVFYFGVGNVADLVKTAINKWGPPDPADKLKAEYEMTALLQQREDTLINAQREIIVAEMAQGDAYTKRTRPTVIYAGLAFIFLVHVFFPLARAFVVLFKDLPPETVGAIVQASQISLPEQFWWAWTGLCGIWMVGRSYEKQGTTNKVISMITGSNAPAPIPKVDFQRSYKLPESAG